MAHSIRPSERPTILLTRPAPQSQRWAKLIEAELGNDIPVVISPVIEIEFLQPDVPEGDFNGVIFTSANAVSAFAQLTKDRDLAAYCVGARTAAIAKEYGFDAISADGSVDDLVPLIHSQRGSGRLLYPRGAYTARNLQEIFANSSIEITEFVTYRQTPKPLSQDALELLQSPGSVLIPLFSPRSAQIFISTLSQTMKSDLIALCFSEAVLEKTATWNFAEVRVCTRPVSGEMIRLLGEYVTD